MNINQKIISQKKGLPPQTERSYSLFVINSHGIVESWNEQSEKNLGYKQLSIVGKHCSVFFVKKEIEKTIKQAIVLGSVTRNLVLKKPDESLIHVTVLLNSIFDKHQQVMGFLVTVKTIGAAPENGSSATHEKLPTSFHKLKDPEDTRELESIKKKMEMLAHSISHDLRAPLRAIDAYLRMIDEDYSEKLNPEINNFLNHAQLNVKKMNALIENLLTLSRMSIRDAKMSLVDMNELANEVSVDLRKEYTHNYCIVINALHPIDADYSLMSIVLYHLLSNAIKFSSQENNPRVEVSSEKKGNKIVYRVKDNGIGIERENTNKLFLEFTKLHNLDGIDGTGMGLVIVKQVIDKHGGNVGFDSAPGKGALFYFSMPARKV